MYYNKNISTQEGGKYGKTYYYINIDLIGVLAGGLEDYGERRAVLPDFSLAGSFAKAKSAAGR